MREKKTLDMCEGPLLGSVLRFSLPLMATGVLSQLYNSMDSVVVGRCAGGSALAGEDSRTAVRRELREETGLAARPEALRLLDTAWGTSSAVDIYLYAMAGTAQIRLQPGETADYRWVSLEELAGMMDAGLIAAPIVPRLRQVWPALKAAMTEAPGFSG